MNTENPQAEILFNQPVKLSANLELVDFHIKTKEASHLLILNDRHFHLNTSSFNLIKVIEKNQTLEEIASEYSKIEKKEYTINEIIVAINTVLARNGIVETIEPVEFKSKIHSLFLKTTLVSSKALQPITKRLQYFFRPYIAWSSIVSIMIANYFVWFHYFSSSTLTELINSPKTLIISLLLFSVSSIFHELGHVSACRYFGAKHGDIGWAIYLRFPVLYSQITDVWRLKGWQRAIIDTGGLYFQFIFNILLFVFFLFTKERIFIYAFQLICIQSIFTLNPFLKFDGYWIATDLLGVPNLRKRSFELFEYIFAKYFIKTKEIQTPYFLLMQKRYMYAFIIYALVSNLFLIYFSISMFYVIPHMLLAFPLEFKSAYNLFIQYISSHQYLDSCSTLFKILVKSFFLSISIYFAFKILVLIYHSLKKYISIAKK
jgi:putative peptide zinc metalloprotease protein